MEDLIGHQKNNKATQAINRAKRPLPSMMAGLQANIIGNRHAFTNIPMDNPVPKRQRLDDHYFNASKKTQSLPFENVANLEDKAGYYSPKSENKEVQPTHKITI